MKGNYWANLFERKFSKYILNPCDYDYAVHFDCSASTWIPKSRVAKWNIEKLRLNSKKQIDVRETRILFFKTIKELKEKKNDVELTLRNSNLDQLVMIEIKNLIEELEKQIYSYEFKVTNPLE